MQDLDQIHGPGSVNLHLPQKVDDVLTVGNVFIFQHAVYEAGIVRTGGMGRYGAEVNAGPAGSEVGRNGIGTILGKDDVAGVGAFGGSVGDAGDAVDAVAVDGDQGIQELQGTRIAQISGIYGGIAYPEIDGDRVPPSFLL